jgi:hypothetical protein
VKNQRHPRAKTQSRKEKRLDPKAFAVFASLRLCANTLLPFLAPFAPWGETALAVAP